MALGGGNMAQRKRAWRRAMQKTPRPNTVLLVNHVFILVRTGRITLWMKIPVSQTIARRHAIRQQKKLVHAFATDLKATGPAGQHKMNCCGPNWPDDLKNACGPAGQRASGHIANVEPWYTTGNIPR